MCKIVISYLLRRPCEGRNSVSLYHQDELTNNNDKVGMFLLTTSWDSGKTYIDCLCRIISIRTTTVNAVVDGQSTNVAYA